MQTLDWTKSSKDEDIYEDSQTRIYTLNIIKLCCREIEKDRMEKLWTRERAQKI
jgi:hypothetical protein